LGDAGASHLETGARTLYKHATISIRVLSIIPNFVAVGQNIWAYMINFIHQAVDKYNETNTGK